MRCGSAAVVLVVLLGGCRAPVPPAHPQRWATAWIQAFNSHRGEQISPLLRGTGTYQDPSLEKPLSGPWLGFYLNQRWKQYPEMHYTLKQASGDAHTVIAQWRATGLAREPAGVVAGVFVLRVEDDSIASVRSYYDAAELR